MKKCIILYLVCLLVPFIGRAQQTADDKYARPLIEVLADIEQQFGIQIKYDKAMIEGKVLEYADWRIRPWSAEESLRAVLAPFDYTFVMDNTKYKIKSFEYARTTADVGKHFLDYLTTLYDDKASWEARKAELKPCLLEALRLSPLPERPDSKVILTKKRKYNGYTVQNFAIETLPGIYVAGSIYRPAKIKGKHPVVLHPNGHFSQGRYGHDQQMRAIMLARMGAICANWDLFAWGEGTLQFDGSMHRLSIAQTIQTLNTMRILDYLLTLKEADSSRVGITGGSGGGSMSMLISAIDDRITLSMPVVMLSSHFLGGCPCESGMPTHLCGNRTNNAELAAMFAPKPQLILSDGKDWSNTVPELELPFLQRTYGFYGAQDQVVNVHFPEGGHDYNFSKREAIYPFVAKHFQLDMAPILDKDGKIDESTVTIESESQMKVFGENGERLPANAIQGRDALFEMLKSINLWD